MLQSLGFELDGVLPLEELEGCGDSDSLGHR
jgi:hypothetical protein